jgi:hypothetical protein
MMGEAHERTIITWGRTVKKLYLASGAIRTRSEEQPKSKTANGELARAISKFNAHLLIFLWRRVSTKISRDFAELFQSRFEVFDDFLGEDVGIGKVVGFFEAFIS